jgi:acyl-CoA reductase-like NAD-dependent aldehyde dehydrogenase
LVSGFGTAGQRCTSLGTVWAHESIADEFTSRFVRAVEDAVVGDPRGDVLYGPMIDDRFMARFEGWLDLLESHHEPRGSSGVGRITAENPRPGFVGDPGTGLYAHPTVAVGVQGSDALAMTETFGPLVGLGTFETLDEAVELSNAPGYGLSSSIYTNDPRAVWRYREGVSAGMVSVNNSTSGAEAHLPFGGNRKSGNGSRQSGIWVLDQFTRWQSMNWDYSGKLQKAQMDVVDLPSDPTFTLDRP